MSEAGAILVVKNIGKTYINGPERLAVLRNVSFCVPGPMTVAVKGESGSGKSTLLNLIGGLDLPTKGEIVSSGFKISHMHEEDLTYYRNKVVGFIFQFHYLLKDFTAMENIILPAYMGGMSKKFACEKAAELLQKVNLFNRKDHYPSQLSGGERQKVAVARALINDPALVLADEPTGNLDEENSRVVADLLFSLVQQYSKTMILVTHDNKLGERGDKHYWLKMGELTEI
ncbi:MAG: ABC transporter ATP-binding protein [Spirochaetota bacterium]